MSTYNHIEPAPPRTGARTISSPTAADSAGAGVEEYVFAYIDRGWAPIPVPFRRKGPVVPGWPDLRITAEQVRAHFHRPCNVGLLCGAPSRGLVDVDLDTREAVIAGSLLLPPTRLIHGRHGSPASHRWYKVTDGAPDTVRFECPDSGGRATLVEVRSDGAQTIVPPSVHPSGELLEWVVFEEPAEVSARELLRAAETTAAAALIASAWRPGIRHQATLALAGVLLRSGWSPEEAQRFITAVCKAADDEEEESRLRDVLTTARRLENGDRATGFPTLRTLLGAVITARLASWLHLDDDTTACQMPLREHRLSAPETPTLHGAALCGFAGRVVETIAPHTEAHPVAILAQLFVAFGNVIGRRPRFKVEADYHPMNLFITLVGDSAKARKGTSWGHIRRLFSLVDPEWADFSVHSGLASGEGLIWAVRDPIEKCRSTKASENAEALAEKIIEDAGVEDKRLLCVESEFASVLKVISREGNTLSPVIRQAWDTGTLATLTKNSPARATGAHISIIGHITREELRRYLTDTEMANGFANRFIFLYVTRSKLLPEGGNLREEELAALAGELRKRVETARGRDEIRRDEEARAVWHEVYGPLSEAKPGMAGSLLARAEA